jgi:hypothetical protein
MVVSLKHTFFDLVRVLISGRLYRRTPMDDMPRDCWMGWYSVGWNHVFLTVWFQREQCEALQYVAIIEHVFCVVRLVVENGMNAEIYELVMVVQVLVLCFGLVLPDLE